MRVKGKFEVVDYIEVRDREEAIYEHVFLSDAVKFPPERGKKWTADFGKSRTCISTLTRMKVSLL